MIGGGCKQVKQEPQNGWMLAVLGGLADVERDLSRPPSLTPAQQKEANRCRAQGATLQEIGAQLTMSG